MFIRALPRSSDVRICLLTGGGYPYRRDALGGWCRDLVHGLATVTFELVTLTDHEYAGPLGYPLPGNVASARAALLPTDDRRRTDAGLAAAGLLCRGLLGTGPAAASQVSAGLRGLSGRLGQPPPAAGPLADALLDAWRATPPPGLPRLGGRDARTAATLLRRALRALVVEVPEADLVHCVGGTSPLLAALGAHWRTAVPLLITEARAPVARYRPAEERLAPGVRMVLRAFRSGVLRTGYAEAGLIAPLSGYHQAWAAAHGAAPARLVPVPAGADPEDFPTTAAGGEQPAIVWAGGGGPDSGLSALLEAFTHIAASAPAAVLHLAGVTAADQDYAAALVDRSGLGRSVRLHPLPAGPGERYTVGNVVVHVPGAGDPPYRLAEAMMSGRAVVGVDVGPVAETLGDTGLLVPPNDPAALAAACLSLLRSPERRRVLGEAARRRALAQFTTGQAVRAYAALYADLAA